MATRACLTLLAVLGFSSAAMAATYTVNDTTDYTFTAVNASTGAITAGGGVGKVSLRSAIAAANSQAGPHTINLPAGTYALSASNNTQGLTPNALVVGSTVNLNTTIVGADAANPQNTIIKMNVANNDVIETAFNNTTAMADLPMQLTLKNLSVSGGTLGAIFTGGDNGTNRSATTIDHCLITGNSDPTYAGGAIISTGGDLTVTSCTISSNSSSNTAMGQGGGINYQLPNASGPFSKGTVVIQDTIFSGNSTALSSSSPSGGAIFIAMASPDASGGAVTITGCSFSGNSVSNGGDGGAIAVLNTLGRTTNIQRNTFTSNQITSLNGHGGAIAIQGGTTNINFNRFVTNSANTATNGLTIFHQTANTDPVNANDNWWQSNAGPAANDIRGGVVTAANWLQLKLNPSPATISTGGTSTLTASFLSDSANNAISAANLTTLVGLNVSWGAGAFGSISSPTAAIQSTGTATATFNGSAAGVSNVSALVDGATATSTVSVRPTVATNTAILPNTATTLTINGTGFSTTPGNNSVVLSSGTGSVTSATATSLTLTGISGLATGPLTAIVTTNTVASSPAIQVANVTAAPVLANIEGTALSYTENATPTAITGTLTLSDADSANLVGATVQITGGYVNGQDVLSFTLPSGVSGSFTAATGLVTFSGSSSVANYQAALRSVTYFNNSENPSTAARTVTFQVNDGGTSNNLSNILTRNINVISVNDNPKANPDVITHYKSQSVKVLESALTANDTDVEGDTPLTITGVSAASSGSATVTRSGGYIFYTPTGSFPATDSFTYTLSDGHGGLATGTVTVNVIADASVGVNVTGMKQEPASGGGTQTRISFAGIPGRAYRVQTTDSLSPATWVDKGTFTANSLGVFEYVDPPPPPSTRYYRSVYP